jgi:acyl carrier protein
MNIKNWINDWFIQNTNIQKNEIEKNTYQDYFIKGWIDSLKFILLISDMEEHFQINFSNDEFQNREFSTINGLTKIIEDKLNGKI